MVKCAPMPIRPLVAALLAVSLAVLPGCEEDEDGGPCGGSDSTMRPGDDCLSCHGFRAAGTIYAAAAAGPCEGIAGAAVTISDDQGHSVTATSNAAGNFFTSSTLVPPLHVSVTLGGDSVAMPGTAEHGRCNECHGEGFRVHVP